MIRFVGHAALYLSARRARLFTQIDWKVEAISFITFFNNFSFFFLFFFLATSFEHEAIIFQSFSETASFEDEVNSFHLSTMPPRENRSMEVLDTNESDVQFVFFCN